MSIDLEGIVIIVGNYGSGKTEVSVNLAVNRRREGVDVRVGDLDLVNPYFRTREAIAPLRELGIEVVVPPDKYLHADLPILSPLIGGMIRRPSQLTLLDAGGDDVGATVLAALADALDKVQVRMIQVVNPFRPFTQTVDGCLRIRREIEAASRLTISGIIGNANLIDETNADTICQGYERVSEFASVSGLPLEFITAPVDLLDKLDVKHFSCPLLPIERQLVPPWKQAVKLGPENFRIRI